jgi:ligand-binding sensor domain-containing protein/signal transduction histidine kinase
MRWLAIVALVLLASVQIALAQTTRYTRTTWRSQDGLPENVVQSLVQDRDGYLWVGTTGGLTRFDGAQFTPFNGGAAQTLPVNSIYCLLMARDGTIWAGTDGGGLLHIAGSRVIKTFAAPDGLTDAFVHSIYEDSIGRLWVGTAGGLFLMEGERLVRADPPGTLEVTDVQAIAEDRLHHILAGGSRLIALGTGQVREIPLPGAYGHPQIRSVLAGSDGTLWIGTDIGLLREVNGRFRHVTDITGAVRVLSQTSDGTVWIGTLGKGLWAFRGGLFTRVGHAGLFPIETALCIHEDVDHRVWIGTRNGLGRLEKSAISLTPLPTSNNDYGTIGGAPNGDVWMVTQAVFRVSGGIAVPMKFPGLDGPPIRSVYRARDGSTWVGTDGQGVYHLTGGAALRSGDARHYAIPNFIRGFLESSRGETWVATNAGLYRITARGLDRYGVEDGLAYLNVKSLFEDRNGDLWIGTDQGLSRWHDGAFVQDPATRALRMEKVWSILQDRRGTMWFGTRDHGLFRYRDSRIEQYTTAQGLVSNSVYQLLQDKTGRFWISSEETISSVPEDALSGDFPLRNSTLGVTLYRMPYGEDGVQLLGGRFTSGYLAPDDTVWFPTNHGAAHVIASGVGVEGTPVVRIVGMMRDGVNIPATQGLQLPAGTARLAFSFAPLFLGPQDSVRFRYILEGFDRDWLSAGSGHAATYTNLPAGTYRFRVQSFDVSHPEQATEATIDFSQRPFLYQLWWFRLFCILAAFGCGIFAYSVHLRRVRTRFALVLEERGRLAREMHDTVIQGCTGVSTLLEAIASQRESVSEDGDLLDVARIQMRETIDEARRAVWNLRRNEDEEIDLPYSLAALAEQATRAFGIPVVCERVDPMNGISGSTGHELLMVAREAIANAGTHAHPDWIRISASLEGVDLTVTIIDNGTGFVEASLPDSTGEHYGLVGMRERMHRIGGTLVVRSVSGSGTEVVMKLWHATVKPRALRRRSIARSR